MSAAPRTIGVAGAGTMGAGIAQLACLSGARTLLHDPAPDALGRGLERIEAQLGLWRGTRTHLGAGGGSGGSRLEPRRS